MRQDILDYLMENQGTFVSGQKISELFGISRTAVWKHIRVLKQRGYVIPEDVRAVCHDVMRHRIGLSYEAEANNMTAEEIISEILNKVEVP